MSPQASMDSPSEDWRQGGEDDGPAVPASPEEYQFEFKPETRVDEKLLGSFQQWAHQSGLPMDKARALVQMYENQMAEQIKQAQQRQQQQQLGWRESLAQDPDFLRNQDKNFADIRRGMGAYNTPGLQDVLIKTGLVDHPDIVRHFMRLGAELAEPTVMRGGSGEKRDLTNDELMQEAGWSF